MVDMQYRVVFYDVKVSYLRVICKCLHSIQIVKHQVLFCFGEFILYLSLYAIALCILSSNCVCLMQSWAPQI